MSEWKPIESASHEDYDLDRVDLWMQWGASPLTMGMGDSFRVVDCWRHDGKWVHHHNGQMKELDPQYITHWAPRPSGPNGETSY